MKVASVKSGECRDQTPHLITWLQHLITWLRKSSCNVLKSRSVISTVGDNRLELLIIRFVAGKCISHYIRDVTACIDSGTLLYSTCFYEGVLISPQPNLLPDVVDGIDSVAGKTGLFMCQTASLFLLQRLKGSMSGDVRDFNNIETQTVIKFHIFVIVSSACT
jgi:hypothetical protein